MLTNKNSKKIWKQKYFKVELSKSGQRLVYKTSKVAPPQYRNDDQLSQTDHTPKNN